MSWSFFKPSLPVRNHCGIRPRNAVQAWWFSAVLLAAYLGCFHSWTLLDPHWIVVTGTAAGVALTTQLAVAVRHGYFVNGWDVLFHGVVIADLVVEAVWVKDHSNNGFYLCATGFALVVGGYRWWAARRAGWIGSSRIHRLSPSDP